MRLAYSFTALRDLSRLPKNIARRITDKMEWFLSQEEPLSFAKPMKGNKFGDYRFRIGNYRVIVDIDHDGSVQVLFVLSIKHRKEVYRF